MLVPVKNFINVDYPLCSVYSIPASNTIKFFTGYLFPSNETIDYAIINCGDGNTIVTSFSSISASYSQNTEAVTKYAQFFPVWDTTLQKSVNLAVPKFTGTYSYEGRGEYTIDTTLVTSQGVGYRGIPVKVNVDNTISDIEIPENWQDTALQYQVTQEFQDIRTIIRPNLDATLAPYFLPSEIVSRGGLAGATASTKTAIEPKDLLSTILAYFQNLRDKQANRSSADGGAVGSSSNIVGIPTLSNTVLSVSSTPIDVQFTLLNVVGRTDVDYIEWSFGDGGSKVIDVRGSSVYPQSVTQSYKYTILPVSLSYTPTVTIYINKGGAKKKIVVVGNQIALQDRLNVIPSVSIEGETSSNFGFTVQPWKSPNVLTEAKFTIDVQQDLQYALFNFDDGRFDIIPAVYTPSLSGIKQTVEFTHLYESTNTEKILPSAIFVFRDSAGRYTTKNYKAERPLEYGRGTATAYDNQLFVPVVGSNGFRKFNNISVQPLYRASETEIADIVIRLDLGLPNQILAFDRLVWNINDVEIVQDKQTSKDFGYLTIEDVSIPYTDFSIKVDVYGIPAVYNQLQDFNLLYVDTYTYSLNIPDYKTSLFIDSLNKANASPAPRAIVTRAPSVTGRGSVAPTIVETRTNELAGCLKEPDIYKTRSYVFNKVFTADTPSANFINRNNPSTVSSLVQSLETKREIGFFRPSKASTIVLDSGRFGFVVNLDRVATDVIYYIPDPFKYGSDSDVLTFNSEKASFKKGYSFGRAGDEPNTTEDSTTFYGYVSDYSKDGNLSVLYDRGYIHDIKYDIFGNEYGLIKDNNNFRKYIEEESPDIPFVVLFNGYKFFDSYFGEGTSFDYYDSREFPNIRTFIPGLSTNTGSFTTPNYLYKLNFGTFTAPAFPTNPSPIDVTSIYNTATSIRYVDGGVFAINDTVSSIDTVSSDLSSNQYPGTGNFYYTTLIEAGAHQATPYIRPLNDDTNSFTQSISAIFTQGVVVSGNNGIIDFDCGVFEGNYVPFNYTPTASIYLPSASPESATIYTAGSEGELVQNKIVRDALGGSIYVKNQKGEVLSFGDAFAFADIKYGLASTELSAVQNFDLSYNTFFIQTPSYLIVDRVEYEDEMFKAPTTPSITIKYNSSPYNALSNRFKYKDNVYFAVLSAYSVPATSNIAIIPQIYRFNTSKFELVNLLPYSANLIDVFTLSTDVLYTEATNPKIVYNEDIDVYNLSYLVKDQNKTPALISINFTIKDTVEIRDINGYNLTSGGVTAVFSSLSALTSQFTSLAQSTTPSLTSAGLIL